MNVIKFGQWITQESWSQVKEEDSTSVQALTLENILIEKVNTIFPVKSIKLSSHDKPFITQELKKIDRMRSREFKKHGKSEKYKKLKKQFEICYKKAANKYLDKSLEALAESKPGKAFRTLKSLGSHPEDSTDDSHFVLQSHENLSPEMCAEKIAEHFSEISREFPPLLRAALPQSVTEKLKSPGQAPQFSEYEVYCKMRHAKKPNSGTPSDIPKKLVIEFSAEIAQPVTQIINKIFKTGEWPAHWKKEYVIPIPKKDSPETEDDLRPISLTPFLSKVSEHFVVEWLLKYISTKLDLRQFGGIKGNSITHYLIEFINFILSAQERPSQTAVLACYVDFQKAFNRQNHTLLIRKLSYLGVPGWLLNIIISFLQNRSMTVRYSGCWSSVKQLPGGGPQGTLLALLLFLVLINDTGFNEQAHNFGEILTCRKNLKTANEIHLKFVDDLTLAGVVDLQKDLRQIPESEISFPTKYHDRTGHVLPVESNKVYKQLLQTQKFASENEMRINFEKTKVMLFNSCRSKDFNPEMNVEGKTIQVVEETKLLGLLITNDLKWTSNTNYLVKKAYKRLWIIKRLKILGAGAEALLEIYVKQIRCILELAVPVWNGSMTIEGKAQLERVQKSALHIILGKTYTSYEDALRALQLESLEERRESICLKFALKAEKQDKFKSWFKPNPKFLISRTKQPKYIPIRGSTTRIERSPIGYLKGHSTPVVEQKLIYGRF